MVSWFLVSDCKVSMFPYHDSFTTMLDSGFPPKRPLGSTLVKSVQSLLFQKFAGLFRSSFVNFSYGSMVVLFVLFCFFPLAGFVGSMLFAPER